MSDLVVHIDEDLDDERIVALEKELSMQTGILSACVHEDRRHLMVVDYDPGGIHSGEILSRITSNGVHAELVGL